MRWEKEGSIVWEIDVPEAGNYRLSLSYASVQAGAEVTVYTDNDDLELELNKSIGPFYKYITMGNIKDTDMEDEYLINYTRQSFPNRLHLDKGVQEIALEVNKMDRHEVIDFRALELTPTTLTTVLEDEASEALTQRASTDWMVEDKYGLMYHWTDLTVNPDGSKLDYSQAVDAFDVDAFVDLNEELGAGFVLFTLNHQFPHCPAPIPEWEEIHPGWTTERDLIQELSDELAERNIHFILYVASHLIGRPDGVGEEKWLRAHEFGRQNTLSESPHFDIFENNKIILSALGERYGQGLHGFWLDGWDLIPESYPHNNFNELFEAAKVGNPDRLVSYNRWIFPTVTPWQDYWAGEVDSPDKFPINRYMEYEVGKDLQFHSLISMEDDWVYTAEGLDYGPNYYKVRYTAEELIEYVEEVNAVQGVVTINLAIYQNGSIQPEALDIMKTVKSNIR